MIAILIPNDLEMYFFRSSQKIHDVNLNSDFYEDALISLWNPDFTGKAFFLGCHRVRA